MARWGLDPCLELERVIGEAGVTTVHLPCTAEAVNAATGLSFRDGDEITDDDIEKVRVSLTQRVDSVVI
jgi:hypothetical protein